MEGMYETSKSAVDSFSNASEEETLNKCPTQKNKDVQTGTRSTHIGDNSALAKKNQQSGVDVDVQSITESFGNIRNIWEKKSNEKTPDGINPGRYHTPTKSKPLGNIRNTWEVKMRQNEEQRITSSTVHTNVMIKKSATKKSVVKSDLKRNVADPSFTEDANRKKEQICFGAETDSSLLIANQNSFKEEDDAENQASQLSFMKKNQNQMADESAGSDGVEIIDEEESTDHAQSVNESNSEINISNDASMATDQPPNLQQTQTENIIAKSLDPESYDDIAKDDGVEILSVRVAKNEQQPGNPLVVDSAATADPRITTENQTNTVGMKAFNEDEKNSPQRMNHFGTLNVSATDSEKIKCYQEVFSDRTRNQNDIESVTEGASFANKNSNVKPLVSQDLEVQSDSRNILHCAADMSKKHSENVDAMEGKVEINGVRHAAIVHSNSADPLNAVNSNISGDVIQDREGKQPVADDNGTIDAMARTSRAVLSNEDCSREIGFQDEALGSPPGEFLRESDDFGANESEEIQDKKGTSNAKNVDVQSALKKSQVVYEVNDSTSAEETERPAEAEPEFDGDIEFDFLEYCDIGESSDPSLMVGVKNDRACERKKFPIVDCDAAESCDPSVVIEAHDRKCEKGKIPSIVAPVKEESNNLTFISAPRQSSLSVAPLPDHGSSAFASGNILTRASLRSIVLKNWKESYWVQYGPTTLLVFRSQETFEEWVKNPQYAEKQRDMLVKFEVDFAEELSKPNVRGYKLSGVKTKAYVKGGPMIHQFKLERWVDLGPSIAAVFGSENPNEIEELRKTICACLKRCPNNGLHSIRDLLVDSKNNTSHL